MNDRDDESYFARRLVTSLLSAATLSVSNFEFVEYLRDAFDVAKGFLSHLLLEIGIDGSPEDDGSVLCLKN
jgi:hypothetical protein